MRFKKDFQCTYFHGINKPILTEEEVIKHFIEFEGIKRAILKSFRGCPALYKRINKNRRKKLVSKAKEEKAVIDYTYIDELIKNLYIETEVKEYELLKSRIGFHKIKVKEKTDFLTERNLRLVIHYAREYTSEHLTLDDRINEGYFGLIKSIYKFDYTIGYRFSTYATWWIKQFIKRAIMDKDHLIKTPVYFQDSGEKLRKIKRNNDKSYEVLMEEQNISEALKSLHRIFSKPKRAREIYIDKEIDNSGDDEVMRIGDVIADPSTEDLIESINKKELAEEVDYVLQCLTPREEKIMRMRFGIGGYSEHKLEEIGGKFNISRERVRQIEEKSLNKIRRRKNLKNALNCFCD